MEANSERGCRRWACAGALLLVALAVPVEGQVTSRVSVATGGVQSTFHSTTSSISADGRFVAFNSAAINLVAGDTNGSPDNFVHDRQIGTTVRVSVDSGGAEGNNHSYEPSISADGGFVGFMSLASNLVAGDTNGTFDVLVRDLLTGTTELVSVGSGGVPANNQSFDPRLSATGRFVAFMSEASNLVVGDTNGAWDVFVRDRSSGTTELVSVDSGGALGNADSGWPLPPSISADGRFVAFASQATNLVVGDTNGVGDVFVRDRLSGTTERVSVDSGGVQGNSRSRYASISADGRFVAFASDASNLFAVDTNSAQDVFAHDRLSGTTARVSVATGGAEGNGDSGGGLDLGPSISADGRFVAFESLASNLVAVDTNGSNDVFVHDRQSGTTERVSVDSGGAQGNADSQYPSISADGGFVAFESVASNLIAVDTNGVTDVFVRDRRQPFTAFCFGDGIDTSHTTPCPCANIGAAGNGCANSVQAGGANLATTGTTYADDVRLVGSGMPATSSCIYLQGDGLADVSFGDGVRCTGGSLIRLRTRFNVAGMSTFPDSTDTITLSARGGVAPMSNVRRYYQTYYRNASGSFCPPETFNVTSGVIIEW